MIDASLFIPLIIIAITQMLKMAVPRIAGWVTILIAILVGIVVALIDTYIGLSDITVAQGIWFALIAVGITVTASKAGGGSPGDQPVA